MKHIAEHYTELEGILCEVGDGLDPVWRIGHRSLDLEELIGRRVRVIVEVLEEVGADMAKRTRTESKVFWLSRDIDCKASYNISLQRPTMTEHGWWKGKRYFFCASEFEHMLGILLKPGEAAKFKLVRIKEDKK